MAHVAPEIALERFTSNENPHAPRILICSDERPLGVEQLSDGLTTPYTHYLGGGYGLGMDVAVAIEMQRQQTGRAAPAEANPAAAVPIITSTLAKVALARNVIIANHEGCAGRASALTIASGIVANKGPEDESIYQAIQG